MAERKNIGWIKFVPSLDLPKERVSIAYNTHDERGVRYAYGYFQFFNGTCTCFWKDGNEQPKSVKAEDIKYWMLIPTINSMQEDERIIKKFAEWDEEDEEYLAACIEVIDNFYNLSCELKKLTKINVFRREYAEKLKSWLKKFSRRPQKAMKIDI